VNHEVFMSLALEQARLAQDVGEVPIGAVLVRGGQVVAKAFNQPIARHDPTAHAEILTLRDAAGSIGNYRLTDTTLYVTVEPCLMCVGALIHARVSQIVYGAAEPRWGALGSVLRAHESDGLNHRLSVISGVLEAECRDLLQQFFRMKRRPSPPSS
jgi:tRNA(adenine34) deaminase